MERLKGALVCAMLVGVFGLVLHQCLAFRNRCSSAKVGCSAPDFELTNSISHARLKLSELRGKPLVLVLGSASCAYMQNSMLELRDMYRAYSDKARFLIVYTKEAHPAGQKWGSPQPIAVVPQATSMEERIKAAADFGNHLEFPIPVVVDTMDNKVSELFDSLPTKLLILDSGGTILFSTGIYDSHVHGLAFNALSKAFSR